MLRSKVNSLGNPCDQSCVKMKRKATVGRI